MRARRALAAALLVAALAGCYEDDERRPRAAPPEHGEPRRERAAQPPGSRPAPRQAPEPAPKPARCPSSDTNCRTASGRILYVERVDPDGDGDAHFVILGRDGITAPGISVIDVKRSLRPRPLPGPGDRISAAGPVYTGSHGQRQIEAVELHVAGRR